MTSLVLNRFVEARTIIIIIIKNEFDYGGTVALLLQEPLQCHCVVLDNR